MSRRAARADSAPRSLPRSRRSATARSSNRLLPDVVHVPANLTAAATSMVAARGLGLSASDLGLAPSQCARRRADGAGGSGPAARGDRCRGRGAGNAPVLRRRAGARIVAPVLRDGVAHPDRDRVVGGVDLPGRPARPRRAPALARRRRRVQLAPLRDLAHPARARRPHREPCDRSRTTLSALRPLRRCWRPSPRRPRPAVAWRGCGCGRAAFSRQLSCMRRSTSGRSSRSGRNSPCAGDERGASPCEPRGACTVQDATRFASRAS